MSPEEQQKLSQPFWRDTRRNVPYLAKNAKLGTSGSKAFLAEATQAAFAAWRSGVERLRQAAQTARMRKAGAGSWKQTFGGLFQVSAWESRCTLNHRNSICHSHMHVASEGLLPKMILSTSTTSTPETTLVFTGYCGTSSTQ